MGQPKPVETDQEMAVVPPCGGCREMMTDYSPGARAILRTDGWLYTLPVRALLAVPYRR
jgi:cytidine deaminase